MQAKLATLPNLGRFSLMTSGGKGIELVEKLQNLECITHRFE